MIAMRDQRELQVNFASMKGWGLMRDELVTGNAVLKRLMASSEGIKAMGANGWRLRGFGEAEGV